MNLLKRLTAQRSLTFDQHLEQIFDFQNNGYPFGIQTTMAGSQPVVVGNSFEGYITAIHKRSGVVAAAAAARAFLMSQVRFQWRSSVTSGNDKLFGTQALSLLEGPERSQLLHLAEIHVSYAGTAFFHRTIDRLGNDKLGLMRPDWVKVILGSNMDPSNPAWQIDAEVLGYIYLPGGGANAKPTILGADEVSRWMPEPDPLCPWRGESWVTSVLREITTDGQATDHLSKFYTHAATPQLVFTVDPTVTKEQIEEIAKVVAEGHSGVDNAYKNLLIGGGASVSVVGSQLAQLDYSATQGSHETRIALRSRVPAVVLGISEGLKGSALNAGNYSQTRRLWSDGWFNPAASSLCAALQPLITDPPPASELTFDPGRIMFLQDDRKDEADIFTANAVALRQMLDSGFEPDSAVLALTSGDMTNLKHSGLPSVQVQQTPSKIAPVSPPKDLL